MIAASPKGSTNTARYTAHAGMAVSTCSTNPATRATLARLPGPPDARVHYARTMFYESVDDVTAHLAGQGYLASTAVATTVFLADRLSKPILVEGPAGV